MSFVKKTSKLKKNLLKKYRLKKSTNEAHFLTQKIIEKTKRKVVNKTIKKELKEYSNEMFGSPLFWPWLSLYTEIKGEFIPGWIPNDYFQIILLDKWNLKKHAQVSDLKTFYHSYFKDFTVKPLIVKVSGAYYDHNWELIAKEKVINLLRSSSDEVVIKKDEGYAGKGIRFLKTETLQIFDLEKENENLVVQPVIEQHAILSELNSSSLNTLRIATFIESDGSVSLKFIFLRFGIDGNRLDNAYSGGRLFFLDTDGRPITGVLNSLGLTDNGMIQRLASYTESLKVPSVKKAVNECIKHHTMFPYVRYIAWDVCIDSNAKPRMIEWNAIRPGMWFAEPHIGPIWNLESDIERIV